MKMSDPSGRVVDVDGALRDDPIAGPADLPEDLQQETAQRHGIETDACRFEAFPFDE
jgi:hypothetical protein